jgi:hypothetical protein
MAGLSREEIPGGRPEGPDVAGRTDPGRVLPLLRRHVGRRPQRDAALRETGLVGVRPGEAQVGDLDLPGHGDEQVRRLDVAMDDAPIVELGEGERRVVEDLRGLRLRQRRAGAVDAVARRLAADELHHQVVDPEVAEDVVDPDEVRVVDPGRDARLLLEALDHPLAGQDVRPQALHGDVDAEVQVAGQVDRPHASLAELPVEHAGRQHLVPEDQRSAGEDGVFPQVVTHDAFLRVRSRTVSIPVSPGRGKVRPPRHLSGSRRDRLSGGAILSPLPER